MDFNIYANMGVIYEFTNIINNKKYIGQTWNLNKRIKEHFNGWGYARLLKDAIIKYGKENFSVKVLFKVHDNNKNLLNNAEVLCIKLTKTLIPHGYNIKLGNKLLQEAKDNIGNFHRGKFVSQETRDKISKSNIGRIQSQETLDKIAQYHKNKENIIYVFDCRTHLKVAQYHNILILTKDSGVEYSRIYESLTTECKFKHNNIYCYARKDDTPLTKIFKFGTSVEIIDIDTDNRHIYESIAAATRELNLGRGIISSIVRGKSKGSKYKKNDTFIKFTAVYVDN